VLSFLCVISHAASMSLSDVSDSGPCCGSFDHGARTPAGTQEAEKGKVARLDCVHEM